MELPWYQSMICAVQLSRNMLRVINQFAIERRHLFFVELFYVTLAMHSNLTVFQAPELQTILWRYIYTCNDIISNPFQWFHPVKNDFMGNCTNITNFTVKNNITTSNITE